MQTTNDKIWLSSPHMGGNELMFVENAFTTNWIAPLGPHVNAFEKDLESYTEVAHAAALNSGTAALHLALVLLGVKAGDEVICQSLTFCGSANPIIYQGAKPVFIDSEPETWNMSPEYLEDAIQDRIRKGKKPKAIIYVHLYGMPAKFNELKAVADKYAIPLIEDAAEALGATYQGKMLGGMGELSVLSFNGNKIITTSGGGALLSKKQEHIENARFLATQARDNAPHYQHSTIGYNYRMSNICAGIGRGQMQVLDERVAKKRQIHQWYRELFQPIPWISFCEEPEGSKSNRWLTTIVIDPKNPLGINPEKMRLSLENDQIESRPIWKPMHLQPVFKNHPYYGEHIAPSLFANGLCLPSGTNMTAKHFKRIKKSLARLLEIPIKAV